MKYICTICGYIYDEAAGLPEAGIPPGTAWEDVSEDWVCPICGTSKVDFKENTQAPSAKTVTKPMDEEENIEELSFSQMSAICSNLAKGCEKQYLEEESQLFKKLADYYQSKAGNSIDKDMDELLQKIKQDLDNDYISAHETAAYHKDRGAMRALVWSEKVTRMLHSLLTRYENEQSSFNEKNSFLENTNIYVCMICGFIYVGDEPPSICPVCKVPNQKIQKVERGN